MLHIASTTQLFSAFVKYFVCRALCCFAVSFPLRPPELDIYTAIAYDVGSREISVARLTSSNETIRKAAASPLEQTVPIN